MSAPATAELQAAIIGTYLKHLKLPAIARDYQQLAREAEREQAGYYGYLQAVLAREVHQREEHAIAARLRRARFPYPKRLEDFDFSVVPCLQKTQVLELAQGAFLARHENVLVLGASGLGKTHLLLGIARALCVRGYRVAVRSAAALVTELELAQQELRLPRLLANLRRYDLVVVDELGYLPFSPQAAELLFQFFADRYERASVGITSNLDFAHWTEVFGHERMTAALLDRLVHRSTILLLEGESYRFRQSLARQSAPRPADPPDAGTKRHVTHQTPADRADADATRHVTQQGGGHAAAAPVS
jgi:DNA replication protein DnaC